MRKNEISIPAGLQEESTGGKPKLMALPGHGENRQTISFKLQRNQTLNYNTFINM